MGQVQFNGDMDELARLIAEKISSAERDKTAATNVSLRAGKESECRDEDNDNYGSDSHDSTEESGESKLLVERVRSLMNRSTAKIKRRSSSASPIENGASTSKKTSKAR